MPLTDFDISLSESVLDLLWTHWSSLGVAGGGRQDDHGDLVVDPEALLMATLHFARRDPRLFDEVLDWVRRNGGMLNETRLKVISARPGFETAATVLPAAMSSARPNRRDRPSGALPAAAEPNPLFLFPDGMPLPPPREADPAFLRCGFLRGAPEYRGMSRRFPPTGAASMLLQLRAVLGMASRSELLMLLATRPSISGAEAAELAGFRPRTAQEALAEMAQCSAVSAVQVGRQTRYSLAANVRTSMLPPGGLRFPPWIAIFSVLVRVSSASVELRAVRPDASHDLSASVLRPIAKGSRPSLERAGLSGTFAEAAESPPAAFLEALNRDLAHLLAQIA